MATFTVDPDVPLNTKDGWEKNKVIGNGSILVLSSDSNLFLAEIKHQWS